MRPIKLAIISAVFITAISPLYASGEDSTYDEGLLRRIENREKVVEEEHAGEATPDTGQDELTLHGDQKRPDSTGGTEGQYDTKAQGNAFWY